MNNQSSVITPINESDSDNLKEKLMKHKIVFAIGVVAVLALIGYLIFRNNIEIENNVDVSVQITKTEVPFELVSISPPPGVSEMVFDNTAIQLLFNIEPDIDTMNILSNQKTEFEYFLDNENPRAIYIKPKDKWIFETEYQFIIKISSIGGNELENSIKFSFTPILKKEIPDVY